MRKAFRAAREKGGARPRAGMPAAFHTAYHAPKREKLLKTQRIQSVLLTNGAHRV
jgi:hypothetical protein